MMRSCPRSSSLFAAVAVTLLCLCAQPLRAQGTLGRLVGTVLDSSGGVLPGATVTLSNGATGFRQAEVTNAQGAFTFSQLPVGTYRVAIELAGFKSATYNSVVINVGQEYSLTSRLEVGAVAETVEVIAGAAIVQTTTPEVGTTVQQQQVLAIPLANRDITNLINLQAGVPAITNRQNTVINGGRPTWTQVTMDGINIQDNFIRTNSLDFLPNRPTSDNVAEFRTSSTAARSSSTAARSLRRTRSSTTRPASTSRN